MAFIHVILHLDTYLNTWVAEFGSLSYLFLFLVIFCETGLVVLPFLPGDSLLFAIGALTSVENAYLNVWAVSLLLFAAAVLGNTLNYFVGFQLGPKIFSGAKEARWLNREYLARSSDFYQKYGGKTIVLTRFVPILRTYAPFVAGLGRMKFREFMTYNVLGGGLWVGSLVLLGHTFGDIPAVKSRFHLVIVGIIVISFVPVAVEYFKARSARA